MMNISVLYSTALLTLLLLIGLMFFIRASAKDRTEVVRLMATQSQESLLEDLYQYFTNRSYRIASVLPEENQVKFEGFVRPSVFLAIFLSILAAVGLLCLTLVLSFVLPDWGTVLPGLTLLAPLAGLFYWKKAGRQEQVLLNVSSLDAEDSSKPEEGDRSLVTVVAHRDELAELQRVLQLQTWSESA
jgi:hypothetical protein